MNSRTKTALLITQAAVILGILGNVLLRATPWGANVLLFNLAFVGGMIMVSRRYRPEYLTPRTLSLFGAMLFFASMFVIRDSIELRVADTVAILVTMGVLILPNFGINQRIAGTFHYIAGFVLAGLSSLFAPFFLIGADIDWKAMPGNRMSKSIFSVLRGLAIALPIVAIFGALLMAADAAFENFANRAINFDLSTVISNVVVTSLLAWLTAGYFRGTLVEHFRGPVQVDKDVSPILTPDDMKADGQATVVDSSFVERFTAEASESSSLPDNATILEHINRSDPPDAKAEAGGVKPKKRDWQNWDNTSFPHVFTLGTVETVLILGLVDLLFLSFVIIQVPYLFGGMELVQTTPDFKLADYARRGFGELVAVAALVLPILLASQWLGRKESGCTEKLFRVLAGIQIGLLFVIMASAVQRLVLLTGSLGYGLTTIRLYPMIFMTWLAVVFIWFVLTVLRGARQHFAWGALWSAFFILGATHVLNPDAFIVRTNIALMQQGREFDENYNFRLSADAVPEVLAALSQLNLDDQCRAKVELHNLYRQLGQTRDLRSWNLSRKTAWSALNQSDPVLHQVEGCQSWVHDNLKLDDESTR
ncbi:MAG: DUF4173 domain-containing protein [Acidobacteriota bacterium]